MLFKFEYYVSRFGQMHFDNDKTQNKICCSNLNIMFRDSAFGVSRWLSLRRFQVFLFSHGFCWFCRWIFCLGGFRFFSVFLTYYFVFLLCIFFCGFCCFFSICCIFFCGGLYFRRSVLGFPLNVFAFCIVDVAFLIRGFGFFSWVRHKNRCRRHKKCPSMQKKCLRLSKK